MVDPAIWYRRSKVFHKFRSVKAENKPCFWRCGIMFTQTSVRTRKVYKGEIFKTQALRLMCRTPHIFFLYKVDYKGLPLQIMLLGKDMLATFRAAVKCLRGTLVPLCCQSSRASWDLRTTYNLRLPNPSIFYIQGKMKPWNLVWKPGMVSLSMVHHCSSETLSGQAGITQGLEHQLPHCSWM